MYKHLHTVNLNVASLHPRKGIVRVHHDGKVAEYWADYPDAKAFKAWVRQSWSDRGGMSGGAASVSVSGRWPSYYVTVNN
jgi:hypothetical protein